MRTRTSMFLHRTHTQFTLAALALGLWLTSGPHPWHRSRTDTEQGSETTEKAVITAIALGLAVALGATISGVVHKYQGQIH